MASDLVCGMEVDEENVPAKAGTNIELAHLATSTGLVIGADGLDEARGAAYPHQVGNS